MNIKNYKDLTAQDILQAYQDTGNYLQAAGFTNNIPKYVDYFEGRQWPAPTEATKNLPRPRLNIIKFISRNIRSGIVNSPVKIMFTAENGEDTQHLNDFHEYIMDELKMKHIDRRAVGSGVKKGTYIYHFYWDASKKGKDAQTPGGVDVELIDMLDFRVANPRETDEQKQQWILIPSRREVEAIKELAIAQGIDPDLIQSDQSDSAYHELEQDGIDYVTVFTLYFRIDGQVYFMKSTKDVIFQEPKALMPDVRAAMDMIKDKETNADQAQIALPDSEEVNDLDEKFDTYPIVLGVIDERENSIYGIGLVEEMIENQDAINRSIAYFHKARRDMALGGWMIKENALGEGEMIDNSPDQVITDKTPIGNWGIQRLPSGDIPKDDLTFVDMFLSQLRTVTGATEVMSGEVLGKNMSGAAIAQLQSQAQQPLEDYRQRFWNVKEKQALVLMNFYRFFYDVTNFTVKRRTAKGMQPETVTFDPKQIRGKKFDVVATAGQGAMYSELSTIQTLENILTSKVLENPMIAKTYIMMLPDKVLGGYKDDMIQYLEEQEKGQMAQLLMSNQKMQQQLTQAAEVIAQQTEAVNNAATLVNENKRLNELILKMSAEYLATMQQAQAAIQQLGQEAATAKNDATTFAQELVKYMPGFNQGKEGTKQ